MNRQQRRAAKAQNRGRGSEHFDVLDPRRYFRPGETEVSGEVLVERIVAGFLEDAGRGADQLPPGALDGLHHAVTQRLKNMQRAANGLPPLTAHIQFTDEQLAEGRALLAVLMPRAAAAEAKASIGIGDALRAGGFSVRDLDAAMVYRAPAGAPQGWHGDIMFAREFGVVGNAIGTEGVDPCATREEAEEACVRFLAALLPVAAEGAAKTGHDA